MAILPRRSASEHGRASRRRARAPALALLALVLPAPIAHAADGAAAGRWRFEALLGGAHNLPTTLRIRQAGAEEIRVRARYRTDALRFPIYYTLRVARRDRSGDWGLDLIHHKLHLLPRPPEVQSFAISHGYNLLSLTRGFHAGDQVWRLGAGAVVAHPENTVRGLSLAEDGGIFGAGYYVAGPTFAAGLGRRVVRRGRWAALAEARVTLSCARVPVRDGHARVPNLALHGMLGLGYGP